MKNPTTSLKFLLGRVCAVFGVAALAASFPHTAHASQTVRELFDSLPHNPLVGDGTPLDGMTNDATTVGLQGYWTNNPPGSTGIGYKGSWTENWVLQGLNGNILPDSASGANGLLDAYSGNLSTLTNPMTGNPYGQYYSGIYSTHPLAPSAYVDFQTAGTNWFSVRIEKSYSWNVGDSSAGLGLATGNGPNDHFIGFGVTRPATLAADGSTSIGDTDYVTQGTLGQAGLTNEDDTGGPYLPLATGPAQLWNSGNGAVNWAEAGLLVGRLVTTPSGSSELDVLTLLPNASLSTITNEPIVWDATYNFTETNVMTQLLVWMHGNNVEYDAIRIGTTYSDVVGLEVIGGPTAAPTNTVYAGTSITLSQIAQVNSSYFPMSYQWLSNGVAFDATATNVSYTLSNTTPSFTADYSIVVSNYFGMLTSAPVHVAVLPPVPPTNVMWPAPVTRYVGSPSAAFTVVVDGAPPFTYQWVHAGTNYGSPTTTANTTNTLQLPPITAAEAGSYSVHVSNAYGAIDSPAAALAEIVPPAGSFAAELTSYSTNLWGYWRLDDSPTTNDPTIYDQWGNHNGMAINLDVPTFQTAAANYVGFPSPHYGIFVHNGPNNASSKVNLPKLPIWNTNMTFVMWVNNGGAQLLDHNGYGNQYGLRNNGGELLFDWGGITEWDSGLQLPPGSDWAFLAIVVQPDQVTFYLGTNKVFFVSAGSGAGSLALSDSDTLGDTAGLYPPGLGRNEWPFSEDGAGAGYNTMTGTWSDVAILYQSLTPQQVTNLFLSGVGLQIQGQTDGAGNLILNWIPGPTLQQADSATGPYTDMVGATPPYTVPISLTTAQKYYRLKK